MSVEFTTGEEPSVGRVTAIPPHRPMSLVPAVQPPTIHIPLPTASVRQLEPRPTLTNREIEVLTEWIRCDSKQAVADSLFLSLGTVNTHLTRIRAKYTAVGRPASTKAALVARALQDGLIHIADL